MATRSPWRTLRENALTIVLFLTFLIFLAGESVAGWAATNNERATHHQPKLTWTAYLTSGGFLEATTENWESEFLEMAAFVYLTACLIQKGSPESRGAGDDQPQDREPDPHRPGAPWPVRRGGWALKLYSYSLTLAFLLLFFISFALHAAGGARKFSADQLAHGQPAVSTFQFLGSSEFWFQSMQNWQSEFLGIGMMVMLSVFLRQKGSPESKPVDAPHHEHE
jgi:hypothetical protein